MKRKLRTIVVDGQRYAWTVRHVHKVLPEASPLQGRCRELFTAFRAGYMPVRVRRACAAVFLAASLLGCQRAELRPMDAGADASTAAVQRVDAATAPVASPGPIPSQTPLQTQTSDLAKACALLARGEPKELAALRGPLCEKAPYGCEGVTEAGECERRQGCAVEWRMSSWQDDKSCHNDVCRNYGGCHPIDQYELARRVIAVASCVGTSGYWDGDSSRCDCGGTSLRPVAWTPERGCVPAQTTCEAEKGKWYVTPFDLQYWPENECRAKKGNALAGPNPSWVGVCTIHKALPRAIACTAEMRAQYTRNGTLVSFRPGSSLVPCVFTDVDAGRAGTVHWSEMHQTSYCAIGAVADAGKLDACCRAIGAQIKSKDDPLQRAYSSCNEVARAITQAGRPIDGVLRRSSYLQSFLQELDGAYAGNPSARPPACTGL